MRLKNFFVDFFNSRAGRSSAVCAICTSILVLALYPPFFGVMAFDLLWDWLELDYGPVFLLWFLLLGSIAGIILTYKLAATGIKNNDVEDREIARIALVFGLLPITGFSFWFLFIFPRLEVQPYQMRPRKWPPATYLNPGQIWQDRHANTLCTSTRHPLSCIKR